LALNFDTGGAALRHMDSHPAPGLNRPVAKSYVGGLGVIKAILAGAALAIVVLFASQPAKAEWLCSADRCVWVTYDVLEPSYAVAWGPPIRPSCYWKQGIFGRWKMICP
jgi:hypothetical protein